MQFDLSHVINRVQWLHRSAHVCWPALLLKSFYYLLRGKKIIADSKTHVVGLKNIEIQKRLYLGIGGGIFHAGDTTWLNVEGKIRIDGDANIGRGCRFHIQEGAFCEIGDNCHFSGRVTATIKYWLKVGKSCVISWNVELIDWSSHCILGEESSTKKGIVIGDHVWIGSGVKVLPGVTIGNGAILAANAVVTKDVPENSLVAGIPARVVRENVKWDNYKE